MVFKVGVNCQAIRNILQNSKLVFPHFNESFWACCRVYGSDKCHVFNIKIAAYFPPRPNKQYTIWVQWLLSPIQMRWEYHLIVMFCFPKDVQCYGGFSRTITKHLFTFQIETDCDIFSDDQSSSQPQWQTTTISQQPATSVSSLPELMPITALRSSVVVVVAVAVILLRGLEIIINVVNI